MKVKSQKFKVFITQKCQRTVAQIKEKIRAMNMASMEVFYVGDAYNLMELKKFEPDMVIANYQRKEIYLREGDSFIQIPTTR